MLCSRFTFMNYVLLLVDGAALILYLAMLFVLITKECERVFKYKMIRSDQN
jgi:hypothetical protein